MKKLLTTITIISIFAFSPQAFAQLLGTGWNNNFGYLSCEFSETNGNCQNELFGTISFNTDHQNDELTGTGTLDETFQGDNNFTLTTTITEDATLWGTVDSSFFGSFEMLGATYMTELNVASQGEALERLDITDLAYATNNNLLTPEQLDQLRNHILNTLRNL